MRWGRLYFAVQAVAGAGWWVGVFTIPFVRSMTLGSLDPVLVAAFDIPLFVVASAIAALGLKPAAWAATGWTTLVAILLAVYATVSTEAGCGVLIMAAAAGASILALCLLLLGRIPTELLTAGPFAFRQARPSSNHVANTFGQLVLFWGLFLAVAPGVIVFLENRWQLSIQFPSFVNWIGLGVLVLASGLGVWSAITMSVIGRGTPLPSAMANSLVIAGPYRFVRNPMAVAGIVQGVAVGLLLSSWLVVVYALIGSILWNYAVRPLEERDLEERFGEQFRAYRGRVRCWVPRLATKENHG